MRNAVRSSALGSMDEATDVDKVKSSTGSPLVVAYQVRCCSSEPLRSRNAASCALRGLWRPTRGPTTCANPIST